MNGVKKLAWGIVLSAAVALGAASAWAGGEMPSGYTEIEYIQGPGNARIVTDYMPQPNTDKIEAVVEWPSGTLNANQAVWCARGNGTQVDSWTLFYLNDNGKFRFDYMPSGNAVSLQPNFAPSALTKYTITAEDNTVTYSANGSVLQSQNTPAYSFTAGSVLALFASHHSGINANVGNYGKQKLYSFKVWRSGELIHYFVPCKDSGGNATMVDICDNPATLTKSGTFTPGNEGHYYDDSLFGKLIVTLSTDTIEYSPLSMTMPTVTVTDKESGNLLSEGSDYEVSFLNTNSVGVATVYVTGMGSYDGESKQKTFRIVSDYFLPPGYRQLEYIRSTGTQYIKTGMLPTANTTVELKFNAKDAVNDATFFGQGWGNSNFLFIRQNDKFKFFGTSTVVGDLSDDDLTAYVTTNNDVVIDYGDHATTTAVSRTASTVNAFNIFADNGGSHKGSWTFYSMKIATNGNLQRYYVPAERESDGAIGLYDRANNVFYANQGTGAFVAGRYADEVLKIDPIPTQVTDFGLAVEPSPVVRSLMTGELLSEGTDYEVSYANNTTRGTAEVIVSGLGTYAAFTNTMPFEVRLPVAAGMKQLEYVELTGVQYVQLGYSTANHQIEVDFQTVTYVNNGYLFGTDDNPPGKYYSWTEYNNAYYWGYNGTDGNSGGVKGTDLKRHQLVYNRIGDHAVVLDGTVLASDTEIKGRTAYNLQLGRRGGGTTYKGRYYFVRITNRANGKVEQDLLPAMNADGVAGFYDRVSGRFVPASGGTALVAGPEVPCSDFSVSPIPVQHDWSGGMGRPTTGSRPALVVSNLVAGTELREGVDYTVAYLNNVSNGIARAVITGVGTYAGERDMVCFRVYNSIFEEYTPLEYIESPGTTGSWLGLDYYQRTSTWVRVVSYVPSDKLSAGTYQVLFGSRRWSTGQEAFEFAYRWNNANKPVWVRNAETGGANNSYPYDEWVELVCGTNNGLTASWKGLKSGKTGSLTSSKNVSGAVPFALFALNRFNGYTFNYDIADYALGLKVASFQICEGETMVRDFKPVRRLEDGEVGLYDPVENVFIAKRGSGAFLAGREYTPLDIAYDIPDQPVHNGVPATPQVTVTDYTTGATLTEGVDYTVSYADNDAPGTARVVLSGIGTYAGIVGGKEFKTYDGGPATPYPNLSRSYVPGGLAGFWDALDNTGTGVHDPSAAVWKDLSGHGFDGTMNGIATWANGNAMHNEADGKPCILPLAFSAALEGNMNMFEFAFRPAGDPTATGIVFSNYKPSNYGMLVGRNNSTTYTDGSMHYYSRKDNNSSDVKLASTVKTNELAYYTFRTEPNYMAAWRDDDKTAVYGTTCRGVQVPANEFIIGGRDDNASQAMRGDISFLRVYNRTLTREERELNRALDLVRYSGRSLKYTLPADLPDGYQLDAARDMLRVRVNANAIGTKGLVSVGGGAPTKLASAWFDVGEAVTMTYTGDGFLGWTNLPCVYTYPNPGDPRTVTFTAGAPVYANALSTASESDTSLTAYSYVQKGLLSLFDAIDNAGTGEHQMTASTPWVDLTGSGRQWILRGSGAWGGNGLTLSSASAYTTDLLFSYETAEFCAKVNSGNCLFVNADDYTRMFIFSPVYGIAAQRLSGDSGVLSGGSALVQYGRAATMTAVYRDMGITPSTIDYFLDGAPIAYGRSQAKGYNVGTYPALGARYDGADSGTGVGGSLYVIRFYSRQLEPAEVAFNAALDQIRYFGADEAATLSNLTLPDGYRWNASAGCLEVRVDVDAKGGTVSPASGTWFRVGTPVTVTFTPAVGTGARWSGLPLKATKEANGLSISFTAAAAAAI